MNKLYALAAGALIVLASTAGAAEIRVRIIHEIPDTTTGEVSRTKEVSLEDQQTVQLVVNYRDGRHKVSQYLDGLLVREVEQFKDGTIKSTRYNEGKKSEQQVTKNGLTEIRGYREDGKLWYTTSRNQFGEMESQYYDKAGNLRLTRTIQRNGRMLVVVLDEKGREQYKQMWFGGIGNYVLVNVEERTATGLRRLTVKGTSIGSADYLKADGTVERTEQGEKLSEPVDQKRLQEFDQQDDPTVPKRRITRVAP